jgi:hypothetical protein
MYERRVMLNLPWVEAGELSEAGGVIDFDEPTNREVYGEREGGLELLSQYSNNLTWTDVFAVTRTSIK